MSTTSKEKLDQMNKRWKEEKPLLKRKYEIKEEKREIQKKESQLTMTKKLILYIFITATVIEIFTGVLMVHQMMMVEKYGITPDMTPQTCLISAVIGEVIAFAVYAGKSFLENREKYGKKDQECITDQPAG